MPTLYVRNFPEDLHRKIRSRAVRRHRSVGLEVIVLVEQALEHEAVRERRSEAMRNIARRRGCYTSPAGSADTLTMLREDRDR